MNEPTRIYLCGPTIYDEIHIGNLRGVMFFDLIIRAKRALGHKVFYLQNITDIDDKIVVRAKEKQISERKLASFFYQKYLEVLRSFGIALPDLLIPITQEISTIKEYVKKLLAKGAAYESDSGIYFQIEKVPNYGMVSNLNQQFLTVHKSTRASLKTFSDKTNTQDFALWKFKTEGELFEFGQKKGRPGWHTECAALIDKYFGSKCDIHGGGTDLVFPHHENENAQHFALYNAPITKRWVHIGQLQFQGQKMSKSLGNTIFARAFALKYSADLYRYLILTTKFSAPLSLTEDLIAQTKTLLHKAKLVHNFYWLNCSLKSFEKLFEQNKVQLSVFLELVWNGEFSSFNKQVNKLISQGHKNFQSALLVSLLFHKLGFRFAQRRPGFKTKLLYHSWQKLLSERKYLLADQLREKLQKKAVI